MSSLAKLNEIWNWYETARDSLRIMRALWEAQPSLIPVSFTTGTVFETQPHFEVFRRLQQAERELDDLTVVALWASIEPLYKKIPHTIKAEQEIQAIKNYRDWIAHGRRLGRRKEMPAVVTPDVAYERLKRALQSIQE